MILIRKILNPFFVILVSFLTIHSLHADDGYKLWLKYTPLSGPARQAVVQQTLTHLVMGGDSPTMAIIQDELKRASLGMLGTTPVFSSNFTPEAGLLIGTPQALEILRTNSIQKQLATVGPEGFVIDYISIKKKEYLIVAANQPVGALYGTYHLLRLLQSADLKAELPVVEAPKIKHRLLNHWDNLDRTIERGYAGFSIWDWHKLPGYIDPRYIDYARANASIGINGTVLTSVNANALVLTPQYIEKVAALADLFRPYGLKVYLTARFSAPIEIGGLETADPQVQEVRDWWKKVVNDIYTEVPDFGGFVVKANSEGQPGPQNYGRSHADGANMLADALAPHGGIVMWRAFVYSHEIKEDRAKQANNEFVPLDGTFRDNVMIQVKNGAIDFQPREPFHPLFGAMPKTSLALELQITKEYLGQATQLVYLGPLFKECLDADTRIPSSGSTVGRVVDGSVYPRERTAIAGVANIGTDRNWTGHPFGQSNWYVFGRLAWNHELSSGQIADEWIKQTFGDVPRVVKSIRAMMLPSREAAVNYMTPLGLHHIMGRGHHYGPGPWVSGGRPDWTSIYYHKADSLGIGFDRTSTGSDALSQYAPEIAAEYSSLKTCPEKYLLWFHHLPWDHTMQSGRSLWEELCYKYDEGVKATDEMKKRWSGLAGEINGEQFQQVTALLKIQSEEARWWRNSCLLYFQQFSEMPFPADIEQPEGALEEYMKMRFPYAPGIRPSW